MCSLKRVNSLHSGNGQLCHPSQRPRSHSSSRIARPLPTMRREFEHPCSSPSRLAMPREPEHDPALTPFKRKVLGRGALNTRMQQLRNSRGLHEDQSAGLCVSGSRSGTPRTCAFSDRRTPDGISIFGISRPTTVEGVQSMAARAGSTTLSVEDHRHVHAGSQCCRVERNNGHRGCTPRTRRALRNEYGALVSFQKFQIPMRSIRRPSSVAGGGTTLQAFDDGTPSANQQQIPKVFLDMDGIRAVIRGYRGLLVL